MAGSVPLVITLIAGLIGAGVLALAFRQAGRPVLIGAGVGAAAGAIGANLFLTPLNYCTFEPERSSLDNGFGLFLAVLGAVIVLLPLAWIINRTRGGGLRGLLTTPSQQGAFKGTLTPALLLAPTVVILALFLYYPSLDTLRLSTRTALLGIPGDLFACVDNFTSLLTDRRYFNSLLLTAGITTAIVFISMALALGIAVLAYQPIKGARIYRTLLIWPYAISPVVAGVIFLLLFNPTGGIINYGLKGVFGFSIPWLNNPTYAPWAVILASVWKSLGFNILFYIAGLQNVPNDLKESAAIDGANAFQRFRHIVFPLLSPITFFLFITNTTYAVFETFGTIDFLTPGGGPLQSTQTLMYRVYQVGIQNNDLGNGAAQSIVLFLLVIGLTIFQFRGTGRRVNYGA